VTLEINFIFLKNIFKQKYAALKIEKTKAVDILFMRRDFAYKGINPLFCTIFTHNFYSTNCVLRFHDLIDSLSLRFIMSRFSRIYIRKVSYFLMSNIRRDDEEDCDAKQRLSVCVCVCTIKKNKNEMRESGVEYCGLKFRIFL
jgi:hypothetical protein